MKLLYASVLLTLTAACAARPVENPPPAPGEFWFDFVFFHTVFDSEPQSAIAVTVFVTKEDPVAGLVSWRGTHVQGDRIGWGMEGREWTSTHWVRSPLLKREVQVDFNSGAVIRRIRGDVEVTYPYGVCQIYADPRGAVPCDGIRYFTDDLRADEVSYVGAHGLLEVVRIPRGRGPWSGPRCRLHGGPRPPPTAAAQGERWWADNSMAKDMLFQADLDWGSRNPGRRMRA